MTSAASGGRMLPLAKDYHDLARPATADAPQDRPPGRWAPVGQQPAFSLRDLALLAGIVRRRCGKVIDEETPIGQYCRALERSVAALEDEVSDWRRRHAIALDER